MEKMNGNLNKMSELQTKHFGFMDKSSSESVHDPESRSICPLLTPSPTAFEFEEIDPLTKALHQKREHSEMKSPSLDFDQDEGTSLLASSPFSSDDRSSTKGLAFKLHEPSSNIDVKPVKIISFQTKSDAEHENPNWQPGSCIRRGENNAPICESPESTPLAEGENDSSSHLLGIRQYRHISEIELSETEKKMSQDRVRCQPVYPSGRDPPSSFFFASWNWLLIRKSCFWIIASTVIACFCVLIGMLASVPRHCYPPHAWYQGTVFYEIFPASFQDSDGDGLGDLKGVALRSDYLSKIGVRAVRLNSIFPANNFPEAFDGISSLTKIERAIGDIRVFDYLVNVLKSKNISVILDLPIFPYVKNFSDMKVTLKKKNLVDHHRYHISKGHESYPAPAPKKKDYVKPDEDAAGSIESISDGSNLISRSPVQEAIEFWFEHGVDGIYFKGLEQYVFDPRFSLELKNWKHLKDGYRLVGQNKMYMCEFKVLGATGDEDVHREILETMDLVDVYLDVSNGTFHIKEEVDKHKRSQVSKGPIYPWIHWNIGNVHTARLAGKVENNFGAILFQFLLPGTISIFYGDEIGLTEIHDPHSDHGDVAHVHHLAPMKWHPNGTGFTRPHALPWLPFAKSVRTNDIHEEILSNMTAIRMRAPSIYMNSIRVDDETLSNWAFRFADENIVVLERFYPRRNAFVVVYNAGSDESNNDLSQIYYRGELVEDSRGRSGFYMDFANLKLSSGEAIVVKLDK